MDMHKVATRVASLRKRANTRVVLSEETRMSESEDIVVLHLPFSIRAPWNDKQDGMEYGCAEVGFYWIPPSFEDFNDNNPRVQITHIDGHELSDADLQSLMEVGLHELVRNEVLSEVRNEGYEPWAY